MTFKQIIIGLAVRGIVLRNDGGQLRYKSLSPIDEKVKAWLGNHKKDALDFFAWGNANAGICVASVAIGLTTDPKLRGAMANLFWSISDEIAAAHAVLDQCESMESRIREAA